MSYTSIATQDFLYEIECQIERMDNHEASLQAQAQLAYQYGRLCDALCADLATRRRELGEMLKEWEQIDTLYGH